MLIQYTYDDRIHTERAGVIPYTLDKDGNIYFLFGVDYRSGDITDFGGSAKRLETAFQTAFREFQEESKGIFPEKLYIFESFPNATVLTDKKKMTIVFIPIDTQWIKKATKSYYKKRKESKYNELYNIRWVCKQDFLKMLEDHDGRMWFKVKDFLKIFCLEDGFYDTLKEKWC